MRRGCHRWIQRAVKTVKAFALAFPQSKLGIRHGSRDFFLGGATRACRRTCQGSPSRRSGTTNTNHELPRPPSPPPIAE
jgi:hypothetical protein